MILLFWLHLILSQYGIFDVRFKGMRNCTLELAFPEDNSIKTYGHAAYGIDVAFFVGLT